MNSHRQRTAAVSCLLALCVAVTTSTEEKPNQLLTAISSTTISGQVSVSATMSGTTLQPGVYEGWGTNRLVNSQALRLVLVLLADGTGVCELDGVNTQTGSVVSFVRGNYTNAPSGGIAGRFVGRSGRFRGRVSQDMASANLRLVVWSGGHLHARRIVLSRVADAPQNVGTALSGEIANVPAGEVAQVATLAEVVLQPPPVQSP